VPDVRIDPASPERYADFRGMPVTEEQLREAEMAVVGTHGDRMRLLTYDQVRLFRDLWVIAAVEDGIRDTHDLAMAILHDPNDLRPQGTQALELFTCDPVEEDSRLAGATARAVADEPVPSERALRIARSLGASLLRLVAQRYLTHSGLPI
jgi:hypothetical protein